MPEVTFDLTDDEVRHQKQAAANSARQHYPEARCNGCGTTMGDDLNLILTDDLWTQVRGFANYLCIHCIETRLGRPLRPDDTATDYSVWPALPPHLLRKIGVTRRRKRGGWQFHGPVNVHF